MPCRVDDDHAVLVEEALVALDQDRQIAAILEAEPGAAVGQHIGVGRRGDVERRAHAAAAFLVAGASWPPARRCPRASSSAARRHWCRCCRRARRTRVDDAGELAERGDDVLALDAGRIALRADQDEVVVHDVAPRFRPQPSATNFSSAARSWTNSTSASPRRPMSSAWPVPTATTCTSMPVAAVKAGSRCGNRPDCSVLVVDAIGDEAVLRRRRWRPSDAERERPSSPTSARRPAPSALDRP